MLAEVWHSLNQEQGLAMQKKDLVANALGDAMLELLNEKMLDQISVADIVERSGFCKRTFYNHFNDKHSLAAYVWRRSFDACWTVNGRACTYLEFQKNYQQAEQRLESFLMNTLTKDRPGQDSLWQVIYDASLQALIDVIKRNGHEEALTPEVILQLRFFVHGIHGCLKDVIASMWIRHDIEAMRVLTPQDELQLMPQVLRPLILTPEELKLVYGAPDHTAKTA
ncbi:MAG: TetR family transcriptional regulator [Coriobacteriales bacterium]|nr:TetR family transcriptional regulator [Coriobacteriales bacterium]